MRLQTRYSASPLSIVLRAYTVRRSHTGTNGQEANTLLSLSAIGAHNSEMEGRRSVNFGVYVPHNTRNSRCCLGIKRSKVRVTKLRRKTRNNRLTDGMEMCRARAKTKGKIKFTMSLTTIFCCLSATGARGQCAELWVDSPIMTRFGSKC